MTIQRMLELLEIEHECMLRGAHDDCDRNCADCDLVQDDDELHEMYIDVISLLKEREAIPPRKESDGNPGKWASWWYVCGACGREIDYHDRFCRWCGRSVKWE